MKKTIVPFALGIMLLFPSCKKNEAGGPSLIRGTVVHHEKFIPDATVYIKFNAKEFPGHDSAVYDTDLKTDAEGRFEFKCYKGDYFLYATGIDQQAQSLYVNGGVPVKVGHKKNLEVEVAVTEKH